MLCIWLFPKIADATTPLSLNVDPSNVAPKPPPKVKLKTLENQNSITRLISTSLCFNDNAEGVFQFIFPLKTDCNWTSLCLNVLDSSIASMITFNMSSKK